MAGRSLPTEHAVHGLPIRRCLPVAAPTIGAGFAFFSLLSFIGTYLFFLAFRASVTGGDVKRYAVLVFFTPTMLFWPSSLGKESWLVFTLGIGAYGAARLLRPMRGGHVITAIGVAGMLAVRPHMGALFSLALAGAYLVRFRDPEIKKSAVAWLIGLFIVGIGAGLVATNFGDELPRDASVEGSTTDQIFAKTTRHTTPNPLRTPLQLVQRRPWGQA